MSNEELEGYRTFIKRSEYQGASTNYKLSLRAVEASSPEIAAAKELEILRQRSIHLCRNSPLIKAALKTWKRSLGTVSVDWKRVITDENGKTKLVDETKLQDEWDKFTEYCNVDGYGGLANTQNSWNSSIFQEGEVFTRMVIKPHPKLKIPLRLKHISPSLLPLNHFDNANNQEGEKRKGKIVNGIEFRNGAPKFYHFNKEKPCNSVIYLPNTIANKKVKIAAKDLLHIYDKEEVSQERGVPLTSPAIYSTYVLEDLTDATLSQQNAARAITWIITSDQAARPGFGGGIAVDKEDGSKERIQHSTGGEALYLQPKEQISTVQGIPIDKNYEALVSSETKNILQSLGVPFQAVTGDIHQVSFSGLKYIISESKKTIDQHLKLMVINLGLKKLTERYLELAPVYGFDIEGVVPIFRLPKTYSLDQLKDNQADELALQTEFGMLSNILAERGISIEDYKQDKALRAELEAIYPQDKKET